jgi:hypothetical protein
MAFKITSITTKPNVSVPDFDVWLSTVPESAIAAFPDAAGKTPVQVIEDSVTELDDPITGFISQGSVASDNDLIWTWEAIWSSQADWANALAKNSYINGNIAQGELAGGYLRKLYQTENGITVENFFSNI